MKKAALLLLLFVAMSGASSGEQFYETQLGKGIRNSDAYSFLLIRQAAANTARAKDLLREAAVYSPDLPEVYFALSRESFSPSGAGIMNSVDYLLQGIDACFRNFWWSFALRGSFAIGLFLSFILATALVVLIRLFTDGQLLSHDIAESRAKFLLPLGLVILSAASPLLFLAGSLVIFGVYMKKLDRVVVYLFLLFLFASPLLLKYLSTVAGTAESSVVRAVAEVNESKGNRYALSTLRDEGDDAAVFSYALALKREGNYQEAIQAYDKLAARTRDPKVLVNLGNCYVGLYNFDEQKKHFLDEAEKYYQDAVKIRPLASAFYNISQVSREMMDYKKGEDYFRRALSVDRLAVSGYRELYSRAPNRFVADETLSLEEIRKYAGGMSPRLSTFGLTAIPAPMLSLLAVLLMGVFFFICKSFRQRAYRCRKCNRILCPKCEKKLTWGQMCPECYGSLIKLDEFDVKERVSRLLAIYDKQSRRKNALKILSFVLPGSAMIYAGRILYGFLFLWAFLFFLLLPSASSLFVTDTTLFSHGLIAAAALLAAAVVYVISNLITRRRIAKGWL